MNNRTNTGKNAVIGSSIYDNPQLFPQSDLQNNKGPNSPKETRRGNVKRVET